MLLLRAKQYYDPAFRSLASRKQTLVSIFRASLFFLSRLTWAVWYFAPQYAYMGDLIQIAALGSGPCIFPSPFKHHSPKHEHGQYGSGSGVAQSFKQEFPGK